MLGIVYKASSVNLSSTERGIESFTDRTDCYKRGLSTLSLFWSGNTTLDESPVRDDWGVDPHLVSMTMDRPENASAVVAVAS